MGVAIAMGGMALASGIMGAFGASSNAKAQAMAAEVQQRNQNFQNEWAKAQQDRNTMRQFQANLERNSQIEKSANRERALSELYLDKSFSNQKSTLSKQTAEVNSEFIGTMTNRNISQTSGTARALLRQNMEALGSNMAALKLNYRSAYKDIENQQNMRLAQRGSSMAPDLGIFLPNKGGIADNSSSILTTGLIQAGLQGAAVGINAQMQYGSKWGLIGKGTPAGGAGGSGNMVGNIMDFTKSTMTGLYNAGLAGMGSAGMQSYNTRTNSF